MTVAGQLKLAEQELAGSGIGSARLDAELLLAHVLERDRVWLAAHSEYELSDSEHGRFETAVTKRAERIPLVHITNHREFYGLEFRITPDVLTPRVETETMANWAIELAPKGCRLLDLGTGSGALAIAIKKHRPDLEVWASEVDEPALLVATANAELLKAEINFVQSDLLAGIKGQFEVIVTNLPYLTNDADLMPEVCREPGVALFGGPDGLDLYRQFFQQLPQHLSPEGLVFTESDPWQHVDLVKMATLAGLSPIRQDYFIIGFKHDRT